MTFEETLNDLYQFDFEVYAHDWLLVLTKYTTGEETVFHNSSANQVEKFINDKNPILIGHNAKYYDQYILKAILSGYTPEEIKQVNDYIVGGGQGFELNLGYNEIPPIWDTIQDIVPMKSLKEIEGNLLLDITETTLSFDSPTKWTEQEYKEVLYYCQHDVGAIKPLFEARLDYFKTKFNLCILTDIDPRKNVGLTNAKLCAKFLEARKVSRDDERDYVIPKNIDLTYIPKEVLEFFNKIHDINIPSEILFKSKLEFDFHGMISVFAWGGAHGAKSNFIFVQKDEPDMVVINADFASLYPHLLALPQYNFISRNIKDKNAYYDTLKRRLELKKQGKKNEQLPLKLILNTTYGCQNNQYNDLYDPKGARGTCITGQLLICELTEKLYQIGEVELVQLNTDGIMIKLPRRKLDEYYKVCDKFMEKCGIELEYDTIQKIVQRDVNNYAMIYGDETKPKIKAKGGCFASLPEFSFLENGEIETKYVPNFKANSMSIVDEALLKKLLFDIPVEETINNCDDIFRFQIITHLGGTYQKMVQESLDGDIELQRNNRIYAGLKPSGTLVKVKPDGKRDSLANCPDNPIIDNANKCSIDDVNKKWYIKVAQQRVEDFLGTGKQILKGRKKLMKKDELIEELEKANKKIEELEQNQATYASDDNHYVRLLKKINKFREAVQEHIFIMDRAMDDKLGGGEYASIGQLYNFVQQTCLKVGLDFSFEPVEVIRFEKDLFKPSVGAPRHLSEVRCIATFTDIDTGCDKRYSIIGSGSDSIDKATSGAETLAFRNWFKFNFTPKEKFNWEDEPTDTQEISESTQPKIPTYIPPQAKQEIKEQVVATKQQESSDQEDVDIIVDTIMEIRELTKNPEYAKEQLEMLQKGEMNTSTILSVKLSVENRLASIKAGA